MFLTERQANIYFVPNVCIKKAEYNTIKHAHGIPPNNRIQFLQ